MSNAEQDVADAIEWGILVRNWEVLTRVPLHDATEVSLEIIARTAQKDVPRLIAEVERLRVVDKAAMAHLDNTAWRSLCHGCNVFWRGRGHAPGCTQAKLSAALGEAKKEPTT